MDLVQEVGAEDVLRDYVRFLRELMHLLQLLFLVKDRLIRLVGKSSLVDL
jgi:hypothetical protein